MSKYTYKCPTHGEINAHFKDEVDVPETVPCQETNIQFVGATNPPLVRARKCNQTAGIVSPLPLPDEVADPEPEPDEVEDWVADPEPEPDDDDEQRAIKRARRAARKARKLRKEARKAEGEYSA